MKVSLKVMVLPISLILFGCASTKLTSFTDPEFSNMKYTNYLIGTQGVNLEYSVLLQSKVCDEIIKRGANCTRGIDLAPPTRRHNEESISKLVHQKGIDGYLVVSYGNNDVRRQDFGYVMQGGATTFGNTTSAHASAIPMGTFNRKDAYSAALIDVESMQKAWVSGATTSAQGFVNIKDEVFTASLAKAIARELHGAGHL